MKKTTQETIDRFFEENNQISSSSTERVYYIALQQFFDYCQKKFNTVKKADVRDWVLHLEEVTGLEKTSINQKISALRSFYSYCDEEDFVPVNPAKTIKLKKIDSSEEPKHLTVAQVAELMEISKESKRERCIVQTLYVTGVRISELLNIRLSDIYWDSGQIFITKAKNHTQRYVFFSIDCRERLKNYLANRTVESSYLFCNRWGTPLSSEWVRRCLNRYSEFLGYKITPHMLRHSFAMHLADKDLEDYYLQKLLGHANINSTKIYTDSDEEEDRKDYERTE
ncbi:tyrosine-type recombinase/integrase [Natranaerobius trueperi]|uniref:Integrase n=1 Tax=Natranaerobius trueperi TaxID=759412 RepID=A0A226BWU0_9FIRM|nr:tyrosine-type recombinase/integrase [Natranaerobius trueperi]OWZ83381.1 integrase [Natranaerobius trueperi]